MPWQDLRQAGFVPDLSAQRLPGQVATSLRHDLDPHRELTELATDLDGAYRAVAGRLQDNQAVRIETADGHDRLALTPLDRLYEPPSLLAQDRADRCRPG